MRISGAHPFMRSTLSGVAITTISLGLLTAPAHGADATVSDVGALQTATSSCVDGDTITLGADIAATTSAITTNCDMTLDLNGQSLSVAGVVITPDTTLTIADGTDGTGTLSAAAKNTYAAGIGTTGASLVIDGGVITAAGYNEPFDMFGPSGGAGIGGSGRPGDATTDAGTVTINGGTVTATGGQDSAGIGGGAYGDGGTTVINGGTVVATGDNSGPGGGFSNSNGAGMGGGVGGNGGTVTIAGGDVSATGGLFAAAVGGGNSGNGGTTTVGDGAYLTATGGMGGAGIGGGPRGSGGTTTIQAGADVIAMGGQRQEGGTDIPAIGPGVVYSGAPVFGTLSVAGTLRIPTTANLTIPADAVAEVTSTGLITGLAEDTDGGQIYGPGAIANAGSIDLSDGKVVDATTPAVVTNHHYAVSFDTQGGSDAPAPVTVFAASFADGRRALPEAPTKTGAAFAGWNSQADGSGVSIDANTTLPGSATDGPMAITAYAQYRLPAITGLVPTITGTAREGRTLTAHAGPVVPDDASLSYRWLENGYTITGATGPTLKLAKRQAARRISVRITAHASGRPAVVKTSARTGYVSSASRRLVLTDYTIEHRAPFVVAATGLRPGQRVVIWLGGRKAYGGRADSSGTVHHTVRFATAIKSGTRRVRVSGYQNNGRRDYTIYTHVTYRR